MPSKAQETTAAVRSLLTVTGRINQNKKSEPADLQQVLLLVAELNRASLGAD